MAFLLEEVATGLGMHIGAILHQQLHTLQAPLLDGDMQGAVASVVRIRALGVHQGPGVARVPVDLQQRQDAGVGPIPKVQHSLHQACLPRGALCGTRGQERGPGSSKMCLGRRKKIATQDGGSTAMVQGTKAPVMTISALEIVSKMSFVTCAMLPAQEHSEQYLLSGPTT